MVAARLLALDAVVHGLDRAAPTLEGPHFHAATVDLAAEEIVEITLDD